MIEYTVLSNIYFKSKNFRNYNYVVGFYNKIGKRNSSLEFKENIYLLVCFDQTFMSLIIIINFNDLSVKSCLPLHYKTVGNVP